jgi:hypothetical protein
MNAIETISTGLKRTFLGKDALWKHISIFSLIGMLAMLYLYVFEGNPFNSLSTGKISYENMHFNPIFFILLIIIWIYIFGYSYNIIHNYFDESNQNAMPELNEKHFKVFFSALPLIIVWSIYQFIFSVISVIPILGWIVGIVGAIVWTPFINFIFIAYGKNFSTKGLYKITLPLTYMKHSIKTCIVFGLVFFFVYLIPLFIATAIIVTLISFIFILLNINIDETLTGYIAFLFVGYLFYIIAIVWQYCMVQIYKEEILPNLD